MSRYQIPLRQEHLATMPHAEAWVGWDNPLHTFFAQVLNPDLPEDQPEAVFWIGTAPGAVTSILALNAQMWPWAVIPGAVLYHLAKDYEARTEPTALQHHVITLFRRS
jgi:hypothetical protein